MKKLYIQLVIITFFIFNLSINSFSEDNQEKSIGGKGVLLVDHLDPQNRSDSDVLKSENTDLTDEFNSAPERQ